MTRMNKEIKKVHVKKDDNVYVLTGKDAGKTGKVLNVDRRKGRVIVAGVNIATKHKKPRTRTDTGGIVQLEMPIDASNVMLVCPKCKRPSKTGVEISGGVRQRVCKACGAVIAIREGGAQGGKTAKTKTTK